MTMTAQLKEFRDMTMNRMPQSIISTFTEGIEEIKANQLKERALQKGDTIPDFSLTDINGNINRLADIHQSEYLILNFYRGGWCPYCNMELRAYESLKKDFENVGANIVAISAEVPQLANQTMQKNAITFPILTDTHAQFMKQVGIIFQLNEKAKKDYLNFGMDLTQIHGNENYELPVPAVYVINRYMEIIFVHFEADYMTRIEPQEILNFINNISLK